MNIFKTKGFHVTALIVVATCITFTYWNLPNTFFQQDEWQTFAADIYHINKGITGVIESFLPSGSLSHFNPLSRVFSWFEYAFYYINFAPYAWQSIILHILNTFLLYYFVLSWLKNRKIAIVSALLFGLNSIPSQVVTWVMVSSSYEIPAAFILLSLLFFQRFIVQKKHGKRNLLLSLVMLFVSLLFHEIGIFLFLFYLVIFFLYKRQGAKILLPTFSVSIFVTIAIYIFIRIPFFFGLSTSIPVATDISPPPIIVFPYRAISLFMKSFAGSFFPEKTLIDISNGVVGLAYPQFLTSDLVPNPFIAQSIVFDLVSYVLTLFIICAIALLIRFIHEKKTSEALILALVFVPLSVLPYGLVFGKAGYASIFEPRFLYVTSIGTSVLLAVIVYWLLRKSKKSKLLTALILLCLVFYVLFHIYQIKSKVKDLEVIGTQRKAFLTTIYSSYPNLPQRVVFFAQSDTAYYGMPDNEKTLPLQIGFGKMLMIWYQKEEKFPGCLYDNNFLISMLDEGYKECEERGFGYFREYKKLKKSVNENNIPIDNIIAYSWSGRRNTFNDITNKIKLQLTKDMQKVVE